MHICCMIIWSGYFTGLNSLDTHEYHFVKWVNGYWLYQVEEGNGLKDKNGIRIKIKSCPKWLDRKLFEKLSLYMMNLRQRKIARSTLYTEVDNRRKTCLGKLAEHQNLLLGVLSFTGGITLSHLKRFLLLGCIRIFCMHPRTQICTWYSCSVGKIWVKWT